MPTLSLWLTAAYRLVLIAAVGFVLWYVHRADQNAAKVQDMTAVVAQLQNNAKIEADNEARRAKADAQHDSDLLAIHALVAARNEPIIVYRPASGGSTVPSATGTAADKNTGSGGGDAAAGGGTCNVRPAISEYEEWVESALADCRKALTQWPR